MKCTLPFRRWYTCCLAVWIVLSLTGCVNKMTQLEEESMNQYLDQRKYGIAQRERAQPVKVKPLQLVQEGEATEGARSERIKDVPHVPLQEAYIPPVPGAEEPGETLPPVQVSFDGIPLPAFIKEVYGDILQRNFEIDSQLRTKQDLVTLHIEEPIAPKLLGEIAAQVLQEYGVGMVRAGRLLRFVIARKEKVGEPPLLVSGRTLPDVPVANRPIFQLVPLHAVRNANVAGWVRKAFAGQDLNVDEDPTRNALFLRGPARIVDQALASIRILDQPSMRGHLALKIQPLFVDAQELAKALVDVLNSEGYEASLRPPIGSIIVLPVNSLNMILVFAATDAILQHVEDWALSLDRPVQTKSDQSFFYYQVVNTRAEELAKVLRTILSSGSIAGKAQPAGEKAEAPAAAPANGRNLVVDEMRNALIYQGSSQSWEELLPVIRQMDRPPRMVLIQVLVAEITLNDQAEMGVEWLVEDLRMPDTGDDDYTSSLRTLGGLGMGASGMQYILDHAGQTVAALNAFAYEDRISVLSTPRIMVKSGSEATIDVGSEVPVITSQSTAPDIATGGTSSLVQEIQYRKTGVLLSVKPVIHSGNQIDLEITQEVSESQVNTTSDLSSPSIYTRRIETSLGLKDGGSVMLGGMISTTTTAKSSGVPFLKDLPLIGSFFRVDGENVTKTELIMLIIPYIVNNSEEAEAVTQAFQEHLGMNDDQSSGAQAEPWETRF